MKQQSWIILLIVAIISSSNILAGSNSSKTLDLEAMTFEIPFDFHVGNQKFAAGKYKLEIDPTSSLMIFTNGDDKPKRIIGEISSGKKKKNKVNQLVFHRYGNMHFLRKVDAPTHSSNLKRSKTEKESKKNKAKGVKLTKLIIRS